MPQHMGSREVGSHKNTGTSEMLRIKNWKPHYEKVAKPHYEKAASNMELKLLTFSCKSSNSLLHGLFN